MDLQTGLGYLEMLGLSFHSDDLGRGVGVGLEVGEVVDVHLLLLGRPPSE